MKRPVLVIVEDDEPTGPLHANVVRPGFPGIAGLVALWQQRPVLCALGGAAAFLTIVAAGVALGCMLLAPPPAEANAKPGSRIVSGATATPVLTAHAAEPSVPVVDVKSLPTARAAGQVRASR